MIKKGKTFTITVYTDAGHGWGKVKRKVLENLGIAPDVSSYSYQYKDNVYLEEDCDLSLLIQRLHDDGVSIRWVTKHTDDFGSNHSNTGGVTMAVAVALPVGPTIIDRSHSKAGGVLAAITLRGMLSAGTRECVFFPSRRWSA